MSDCCNLQEKRALIAALGEELFNKITGLPEENRSDDRLRTGLQIVVREPGTINLITVTVKEPSELSKFFVVEKAVRSSLRGEMTSAQSRDADCFQFGGSVTVDMATYILQVSVSGLKEEEDAAIAILLLAAITEVHPLFVCGIVNAFYPLPAEFNDENHYLGKLIHCL